MSVWTKDELDKVGAAEELRLASVRRDGSLSKPVTVWVVRHGADVYVRAFKGRTGAWFRGTQVRRDGRITAGGVEKDVRFIDGDPNANDSIDAVYRAKYRRHGARFVEPMVSPAARAATLEIVPRSTESR